MNHPVRAALLPLALIAAAFPVTAGAAQSAGRVAAQPARDVGIGYKAVSPLLRQAVAAPYGRAGTRTCAQLASGIAALTREVGPDFGPNRARNERSLGAIAGSAVVNSVVPFRGIVREVSGAAGAQRRRQEAVTAGVARRGFLRGIQAAKGCRG